MPRVSERAWLTRTISFQPLEESLGAPLSGRYKSEHLFGNGDAVFGATLEYAHDHLA